MEKYFVFTEAFNCGKILSVCLESFHKNHNYKVHIIGTDKDFLEAGEIINHPNNVLINWSNNQDAKNRWSNGHQGTALAFANCMAGKINTSNYVVHFDADCYFMDECLTEIFTKFEEGYDIIGTPRPYKNNLSGVRGLENTPDCVSTYLMGVNTDKITPNIDFDTLVKMCGGWAAVTRYRILDFFDPVTHCILSNGGKIFFLDTNKYGGISLNGSKENGVPSNLNYDCGEKIAHFGGVGSGKAVDDKYSSPPDGYANWAYYRWNFYSHVFFNTPITQGETVYSSPNDHRGLRWCNGPADNNIITNSKIDLKLI